MTEKAQKTSMTTIVGAVNLKKTYMLGKVPVNALRGVNFRVKSGNFLAIKPLQGLISYPMQWML